MPIIQIHCSSVEAYLYWKCCCYVTWIAWDILFVMSSVTGNLCNKCPKWLVKQNSSYSDYFNAISGFTSNSRAPGGPVTFTYIEVYMFDCPWQSKNLCNGSIFKADQSGQIYMSHFSYVCKIWYPLNLVLENLEYLWFYWTFWIVILDYGLKLHKLSIHTLVMLQKWVEIH